MERLLITSVLAFGSILASSSYVRKSPAEVFIPEQRSDEDFLRVTIRTQDRVHLLRLKPVDTIWDEEATFMKIGSDHDGNTVIDENPLPTTEPKVYHDSETGAVVAINGNEVEGIIGDSLTINSNNKKHFVYHRSKEDVDYSNDYLIPPDSDIEEKFAKLSSSSLERQTGVYTVEMLIVVDSALSAIFPNDAAIYNYITIFWNAVNARFSTINTPKFVIKLLGAAVITSATQEPFIANNYYNGSSSFIKYYSTLSAFGNWILSKITVLKPFDLAYLQTARNMVDEVGSLGVSVAGLAYVKGVCPQTSPGAANATGMGEDNGYYAGVHVATHEVAHNLGSAHDGDAAAGTAACLWSDGYIMGYVAGSINRQFFSNCSINNMTLIAQSAKGSCLSTRNANATSCVGTTNKLPGHVQSMTQTCAIHLGNPTATVYNSSNCIQLTCKVPVTGGYQISTFNNSPPEGASCNTTAGVSGRCFNGVCNTTATAIPL